MAHEPNSGGHDIAGHDPTKSGVAGVIDWSYATSFW